MSLTVFLADDHAGARGGLRGWGTAMRRSLRPREARAWQPNSPISKGKDSPDNCQGFSLELSRFPDRQKGYFPLIDSQGQRPWVKKSLRKKA